MEFYKEKDNILKMMSIINGESKISLRIVDWFVTNYAKKNFTIYEVPIKRNGVLEMSRFKVYHDYKLKLKSYSKKRFDPFCRWDRISIPYDDTSFMETTLGQLNFFKWAIENKIIDHIQDNYHIIECDMNNRNSTSKKKQTLDNVSDLSYDSSLSIGGGCGSKTRKKREELSISACKCIKKENVKIVVKFN
jgi:hypothetical protein